MLEEHFYWCLALERWVYLEARDVPKVFAPYFPWWVPKRVVAYIYTKMGRDVILEQAKGAGMGRHSREEVEAMGK